MQQWPANSGESDYSVLNDDELEELIQIVRIMTYLEDGSKAPDEEPPEVGFARAIPEQQRQGNELLERAIRSDNID